uniref:Putative alkylated dna repair protein alkb log 1 n=1 Tax=Ixodes ricinus TaxID=34613 RepID=A0A131XUE1_IXORI
MEAKSDPFKEEFKFYKRRSVKPDLSGVVDALQDDCSGALRPRALSDQLSQADCERLGLRAERPPAAYELVDAPGLLLLPNPFTAEGQRRWVRRCLEEYARPPHVTNVKAPATVLRAGDPFYGALRWATVGLHHDWDTKVYDEARRSPFPDCLRDLATGLARLAGFGAFRPEAAIVNYYAMDSALGGHVDNSELALDAPVVSASFGQTAVFLVGGATRERRPHALLLRSGDVLVMSGPARLAYHAVPRVLPAGDDRPWAGGDAQWAPLEAYLDTHRISISVRQVFPAS